MMENNDNTKLNYRINISKNTDLVLEQGLLLADKFINKNYLINLNNNDVIQIDEDMKRTNFLRLYKITKLVYDPEENVNDKLISVYSALQNLESTGVLVIESNENGIEFFLGVRSIDNAATCGKILEKSIKGNYPGSKIEGMKNSQIEFLLNDIITSNFENTEKSIATVSIVPSGRDEDKDKFVQGIEKFIDTMNGEKYTAIFIASPLNKEVLEQRKRGFEELYSTLSSFSRVTLAYGENYSKAVTQGMFENFSSSISNSISNTNSYSTSKSSSFSTSTSRGDSFNFGGFGTNSGRSESVTQGYSSSNSWSKSVTEGTAETKGSGTNNSDTLTQGDSRNLTVNFDNKSVQSLMEKIDEHLERIKLCESFGLWECACYFISQDIQTAVVAANTYKALMAGNQSGVENSFVNLWSIKDGENTKKVLEYLKYCVHPRIRISSVLELPEQFVTPTNLISGNELPIIMGLPQKSITGVTVMEMAEFGRNVFCNNILQGDRKIKLGNVLHMGVIENNDVFFDVNSFSSHCFITGSTGSGKSNTSYKLLEEFLDKNIKFLVIEPAKGEYKKAFGAVEGINIFCTNPKYHKMLKLNPFKFNENIHILEHLDRLIEIFNACWPMYAAMPAILKEAIEKTYISCGWDLINSIHIDNGKHKYPTFNDVLVILPNIINQSSYSSDTKGDYIGALATRISSLTNGITGQIFCDSYDINDVTLFDENTIVDLSRVGSSETKSLIMGILIMKLNEHRTSTSEGENIQLKHITVIEEAHNLLKRTSTEQSQEGSNLQGKSVEMISNSIAEMRTYGEGFIIIDQSPTAVDVSAIKNTNTKIIMRLPDQNDCMAVGKAAALNENQTREISKLGTGAAVVIQNNWLEPVMTQIDQCSNVYTSKEVYATQKQISKLRGVLTKELYKQFINSNYDLDKIIIEIDNCEISKDKKDEYIAFIRNVYNILPSNVSVKYFSEIITNLLACRNLFDIIPINFKNTDATEPSQLSSDDINMAKAWYKKFIKALESYADFNDDSVKREVSKYLIYYRASESKDNKFLLIYQISFS
ncbi:ATP-binding protein [Clostridium saccharoperbutylacetonicum]